MEPSVRSQAALSEIKEPPATLLSSLRYMGPGLILSAAIVGSGELIATTTLGARAGFSLLWVILLGCVVKVTVQLEYGKYCIRHGIPSLQAWNRSAGRRIGGLHWSVFLAVAYMILTFFGQAGVLGGSAQVLNYFLPAVSAGTWAVVLALSLALLVFHGRYDPVEWLATAMNFVFVLAVLYCVFRVQRTAYAFSAGDLLGGLSFHSPPGAWHLAVAAFGITGVASGEIFMYPYWCLEKGYARWTGPREDSPDWVRRARGWNRVMTLDAVVSMLVYTVATACFYILGATVLHNEANLADGSTFIQQLSVLFTRVLGEDARVIFMVCAFTVLYSTVFANTAGFSRLWTDFFGLCRWVDWEDRAARTRSISLMAWVFPFACALIYFLVGKLLVLIILMGLFNAAFLLVVAYQAVVFRYRHTEPALRPSAAYDAAFWVSLLSILFMAGYTVYSQIPWKDILA